MSYLDEIRRRQEEIEAMIEGNQPSIAPTEQPGIAPPGGQPSVVSGGEAETPLEELLGSFGVEYQRGPYGAHMLRLPGSRQWINPIAVVNPLQGTVLSVEERLRGMVGSWSQAVVESGKSPVSPAGRFDVARKSIAETLAEEPRRAANWPEAETEQTKMRYANMMRIEASGGYLNLEDYASFSTMEGHYWRPASNKLEIDEYGRATVRRRPERAIALSTLETIPGVVRSGESIFFGSEKPMKHVQLAAHEKVAMHGFPEAASSIIAQGAEGPETGYRVRALIPLGAPVLAGQGYMAPGPTRVGEVVHRVEVGKETLPLLKLAEPGLVAGRGRPATPFSIGSLPVPFTPARNWDRARLQDIGLVSEDERSFVEMKWRLEGGDVAFKWGGIKSYLAQMPLNRIFPTAGDAQVVLPDVKNWRMIAGMVFGGMGVPQLQELAQRVGGTLPIEELGEGRQAVRWGPEVDPLMGKMFHHWAEQNLEQVPWTMRVSEEHLLPFATGSAISKLAARFRRKLPDIATRAAIPGVESIKPVGRGIYEVSGTAWGLRADVLGQFMPVWSYGRTRLNVEEMARVWETMPGLARRLERYGAPRISTGRPFWKRV